MNASDSAMRSGSPRRLGQPAGLGEALQDLIRSAERKERRPELQPNVDGVLGPLPAAGHVLEGVQRLLELLGGLAIRGAAVGPGARLAKVRHRLLPRLAADGVVREPLDLLGQALGVERLDGLDDPGVQRAPALLEQAAVGDLVGERVLEGVLEIREQARLVEELRRPGGV